MRFIHYVKTWLLAATLGGLMACSGGEAKFDLSSEQAFEESIEKIADNLTEEEQVRLTVIMAGMAMEFGGDEAKLKKAIHGKTAQKVIAENKGKFKELQSQAEKTQNMMKQLLQ